MLPVVLEPVGDLRNNLRDAGTCIKGCRSWLSEYGNDLWNIPDTHVYVGNYPRIMP